MKLLYSLALIVLYGSCNIVNPDEREPAYLIIDDFNFTAAPGQGTSSEKITEMWVYADDNIVGVFAVPSRIPILKQGSTNIKVFAGIKNDGVSASRIRYPFYTVFEQTSDFQPLQSDTIRPQFSYIDGLDINASRDFEGGSQFVAGGGNVLGEFNIVENPQIAFEGNKCAMATLPGSSGLLQYYEDTAIQLPSGEAIFLEMNYSCNNTFAFGVVSTTSGSDKKNPVVYITPTTEDITGVPHWNKIYIDLGAVALENPNASYHKLYFECDDNEVDNPILFFDNLKIIRVN